MKNYQKNLTLSLLLIASTLVGCRHETNAITEIASQEDLRNLLTESQGPIVVAMHMQNCGWCKKMEPIIEQTAQEKQLKNISFYRANGPALEASDIVKEITGQEIPGYPFILFMNKGRCIGTQIGGIVKDSQQKARNLSEQKIFAEKIATIFKNR